MNRINFLVPLCTLLSLLVCNAVFGQNPQSNQISQNTQNTQVTGFIKDSLSGNAEAFTIVQFYKAEDNSKPIAYTTTDESGKFVQKLSEVGNYRLLLDNLGKKKKFLYFSTEGQSKIDLGTILVEDDVAALESVTVTALSKLVTIDVDRITYKVENDVEAKTKTVLDILRKVPLVSVDGMGKITVNGNTSFLVYMDGKKNQLMSENPSEIFRSMPAIMVKDIEVITDPGARYDAEGVGGVLNITSNFSAMEAKKGEDMHNGNISLSGSTRKINGGAYFSAKKDKWTYSFNLNAMRSRSGETGLYSQKIQNLANGEIRSITSGTSKSTTTNIFADMSASYEIDKHNLLTFSAGLVDISNKESAEKSSTIEFLGESYNYGEESSGKFKSDMINANIDYQHTWKNNPNQILVFSYQFNGKPFDNYSDNRYTPTSSNVIELKDRKDDVHSNSLTHTIQSDFILPLAKRQKLSTGAKFMIRHNLSDIDSQIWENNSFVADKNANLDYDFYNNIGAVYAEYDGTIGDFKLRSGVRYEHTWQNASYNDKEEMDFRLNYGNLVPNISFQYNINETQNIGVTYSMSIKRPGITYLNPYVDVTDPSSKTYGNPNLKAETGHQIGLAYNFFSPKWLVSLKLQQVFKDKGISPYIFYDDSHILNTTYGNIVTASNSSVNAFISWNPAAKTRITFNGSASYNVIESNQLNVKESGWIFDSMANIEQILPADYVVNFSIIYLPNVLTLQSETSGIWDAMLSISKSFLKERLNVSLSGMSNISKHKRAYMTTESKGKDFTYINKVMMPWKDIFLNVSYSFGSQNHINIKKSKKAKSSDDQLNLD